MRELLADAAVVGWEKALGRFTADVLGGELREPKTSRLSWAKAKLSGTTWEDCLQDLVDPARAGWKFLVDLRPDARVVFLGPSWGAVPLAIARSAASVLVLDGAIERLQLVAHQARAGHVGNVTFACVRDPLRLPLARESVEIAVVPGLAEWFAAAGGSRPFGADCGTDLLRELRRILVADGQVYIGTANRFGAPGMLLGAGPGTAYSPQGLRLAAEAAGFAHSALFAPIPFRHKFHQVLDLDRDDRMNFSADPYRARGRVTRPLIRAWDLCNQATGLERRLYRYLPGVSAVLSSAPARASFAEHLLDHLIAAGHLPGPNGRLSRYYVRPKGVVVLVTESATGGAIVRLPLDERAEAACARHHRAIETLTGDRRLSPALQSLFPAPIAEGRFAGQPYFAESALGGESGRRYYSRSARRYDRAILNTVSVLAEIRRATEQPVVIDEAEFARLCGRWLAELRVIVSEGLRGTLDAVERGLRGALLGTTLPLGWYHGDLDFANLLYAPDDTVTGILDFEVFDPQGLPLLDLLFLLARRPVRSDRVTFGTIFTRSILPRALPPLETALLEREVGLLGADDRLYRALALCCWLNHLRLRRDSWLVRSPSWLEANLQAVVERVRSTL